MPFKSDSQRRWMYVNHPAMAKRWQKETPKGDLPEKVSSYDDTAFSEDPTQMMPRLRQIHKLSEFPTGSGPEDLDAMKQSPGKVKSSQGFEYAETGTNAGRSGHDGPKLWSPGKIKRAAGMIPSMSEQFYMQGMGDSGGGGEETMPIELVSMAGPQAAQGAQMAQMANRLAQRPGQRMAQQQAAREADRGRIVQGLARDLERLKMEEAGIIKKPGLLDRIMNKQGSLIPGVEDRAGMATSKAALTAFAERTGVPLRQVKSGMRDVKNSMRDAVGSLVPKMEKKSYRLQGQTEVQGIPIAIENKPGSVRKGTDSDGNEWKTKMKAPYGYIKGTKGADGDEVDAFVGPDKEAPNAFVVHQHKPDGTGYDEDKVILGTGSKAEAKKLYLAHYDDPKFLGPISRVSTERLKELVASKKQLVKISQVSYRAMLDELMREGASKTGEL